MESCLVEFVGEQGVHCVDVVVVGGGLGGELFGFVYFDCFYFLWVGFFDF